MKALISSVLVVDDVVEERDEKALMDSGCSTTVLAAQLIGKCEGKHRSLETVDGRDS